MATYDQRACADSIVGDHNVNDNFGTREYVYIGEFNDGSIIETFMNFDISSVPSSANINSAKFRMYQFDSPNDWLSVTVQFSCEMCGESWTELGITWGNKPINAAGTPQATVTFSNVISSPGYIEFDVSEHIQKAVNGEIAWNGFRVRYLGTSSSTMKYFRSREFEDLSERPQLIIDYTPLNLHVYKDGWKQAKEVYVYKDGWKQAKEVYVYKDGWK